jgi:SAM-dependent methyltransferase
MADTAPSPLEYFSGLAQMYAEHRPSYPPAAIDAVLAGLPQPVRVADVGCGTGISTRLLAQHGARVIGVDPNADMLTMARAFRADHSVIEYRTGTADCTGLAEASVDVVVCAQSFHWFDSIEALREFRRILVPSGRLALMWNVRDENDPFTAAYSDQARRAQADAALRGMQVHEARSGDPTSGGYFGQVQHLEFPNAQPLSLDGLLGRARSASYFPKSSLLREQFESELRQMFERFQVNGLVILLHVTRITLARSSPARAG